MAGKVKKRANIQEEAISLMVPSGLKEILTIGTLVFFEKLFKSIKNLVNSLKGSFDKLPTPMKIIFYGGISLTIAQVTGDVERLQGVFMPYIQIGLGVLSNLTAWKLLNLKK